MGRFELLYELMNQTRIYRVVWVSAYKAEAGVSKSNPELKWNIRCVELFELASPEICNIWNLLLWYAVRGA